MKTALITGMTGQDGSYLTELLLGKGYMVHGMIRRGSTINTERIDHLYGGYLRHDTDVKLQLHYGDLTDPTCLRRLIDSIQPDEIYHLGAQSHVRVSFDQPVYTADVSALGTLRLLESVRDVKRASGKDIRVYNACTSEMFGGSPPPQSETTRFRPQNPYAVAKLAAYWFAVNYREAYGLFVCNGILFNHASPRRGETFVTRKVTRAVGRIAEGLQDKLFLGNLEARRDWGYAGDFVEAMWSMLQQSEPDDFVIATGISHSIRDLLDVAFGHVGMDWQAHVAFDARYVRPTEVNHLRGDWSRAHERLGWEPHVGFEELLGMMVVHDCDLARQESILGSHGHKVSPRGAASP